MRPWLNTVSPASDQMAALAATVPVIETERLVLRLPRISDWPVLEPTFTTDRAIHIGGPMSAEDAWLDFNQLVAGWILRGHGALTMAMSLPGRFKSVSAFAPISHPTGGDWGRKQLVAYLGSDEAAWAPHDATLLLREKGFDGPVLIDTGTDDQFGDLLGTEHLAQAMAARRQDGQLRLQKGYDHSYFFIASLMEDHVAFHAEALYR